MKKILAITGIILFVVLFQLILSATDIFNQLELMTYDIRAKIAVDDGPFSANFKPADKNIVIVAIDDYSRKELAKSPATDLGSFPWPRGIWGNIIDYIEAGKPKAILFDLIFNDLNANPQNDIFFSNELKKYKNVVLATSLNDPQFLVKEQKKPNVANSRYSPAPKTLNVDVQNKKLDDNITYYSHAPINDMYTKYNLVGVVNKVVGTDSVIRNAQPLFKLIKDGKTYYMPSLSFAGFLKYMGEDGKIQIKNNVLTYKGRQIPIDNEGTTIISWHGTGHDYEYIPISKIILSQKGKKLISPNYFKNKMVIIGRTEAGTDIHSAAVSPSYAGPESNAVAMDNFINDSVVHGKNVRKFVSRVSLFASIILVILCSGFIVFLGTISKNALVCFINSIWFIALYMLVSVWLFSNPQIRLWVPIAIPVYYFIMTGATMFAYRFQQELSRKAVIMTMFGKFVSPKVLTTLLKHQENLMLKSTKKRITVMFCDVKSFTTLSEKHEPEELVSGLNELFDEMVNIIFENNGTVDKFIGDCIMAFWGEPFASEDDAYMAVKTALEMKKKVKEMGIENAKQDKIIFDIKIGINTGDALLGLSGSQKLMSFTAMGDAVNVASRLESNCSAVGKDILISKSAYEDAKDKIVVLEAGKISVKGREEQIEIYEPIGLVQETK